MSPSRPILVVDDDLVTQSILQTMLGESFTLLHALSESECRAQLDACSVMPMAILLDLFLGESSGAALYLELSRRFQAEQVPIVIVTAMPVEDVRAEFPALSDAFILQKPFRQADLLSALAR